MKLQSKLLLVIVVTVLACATALPAKAFYIEVPQILQNAILSLKTSAIMAQEGYGMTSTTSDSIFCNALGRQTTKAECDTASGLQSDSAIIFCNILGKQTTKVECDKSQSSLNDSQPQNQQQNNNQPMMDQQQSEPNNQMMGGQGNGDDGRYLQDVQKGSKQMERSLKQFDILIRSLEKAGTSVDAEIKTKADTLRSMLEKAKTATNSADLQDFDMGEANQLAQDLEQFRRDTQEQLQRLKQVKQQIRNAETAVKSFEKQVNKAKSCVTEEVKTKLTTLKATISTIKNAKTWTEGEMAGLEDLGELFTDINDSRNQLEICARWPQILQQVDRQLKDVNKQLTKNKIIVAKLSAKGTDLSVAYSAFEAGIAKMKTVREEAVVKMKTGDVEGAVELLQSDFYGQMDDVMQNQQTIQMMNSLGTFNSQFKRGLTNVQKQINALKKKKIDTVELVDILARTKTRGAEVLALIKQKDVDLDAIMTGMEDLQDLRAEFGDKVAELTGNEDVQNVPGMLNQPQFKAIQMPSGLNQFVNQAQGQQMQQVDKMNSIGESNPQPSPAPMMAPGT